LAQLFLHLFEDKGRAEKPDEFFALHCEPQEVADSHKSRMKRGPHVHVVRAGYPLSRAHFPLNLGHINEVLTTLSTLTAALNTAIQITQAEVIEAKWT
jgi:hypothetical protein